MNNILLYCVIRTHTCFIYFLLYCTGSEIRNNFDTQAITLIGESAAGTAHDTLLADYDEVISSAFIGGTINWGRIIIVRIIKVYMRYSNECMHVVNCSTIVILWSQVEILTKSSKTKQKV